MSVRQVSFGVIGALLLALLFAAGWAVMQAERGPAAVTTRAPEFSAVTIDPVPERRTLADYRDHVVLLNIWATWCAPCRVEMPSMQALYEDFRDRGLRVVAVSLDQPGSEEVIRQFVDAYGLTFDILYDPEGAIRLSYQITGIPESFVIARDGTIRRRVAGAEDWNSPGNRALMQRLLTERQSGRRRGAGD